jgi:glutaredoxin
VLEPQTLPVVVVTKLGPFERVCSMGINIIYIYIERKREKERRKSWLKKKKRTNFPLIVVVFKH